MGNGILVHPILIDSKKRVGRGCEKNPGGSTLITSRLVALASTQRHGGAVSGASGVSIWSEFYESVLVKSGGISPFSQGGGGG